MKGLEFLTDSMQFMKSLTLGSILNPLFNIFMKKIIAVTEEIKWQ